MKPKREEIEEARCFWARIARNNGWYVEPFHVQVWYDEETGHVTDSLSFRGLDKDIRVTE